MIHGVLTGLLIGILAGGANAELGPAEDAASSGAPVVELVGSWRWVGGAREAARQARAIEEVADSFPLFVRNIARRKIREALPIEPHHDIAIGSGSVTIRTVQTSLTAPADGRPVRRRNGNGDVVTVRHFLSSGQLVQILAEERGSRRNVFTINGPRLKVFVTISSSKLPHDLRYTLTYERTD